jgi:hypothetical protein
MAGTVITYDLVALINPVVRLLLGEPNKELSSKKELRYGSRGSLSIDLEKGTWFDHEQDVGGGTLDLITRETGLRGVDRWNWMREHGFEVDENGHNRGNGHAKPNGHDEPRPGKLGKIVASYPYTDESGALLFEVVRFEPKDFRQRRRNEAGKWEWSVKAVRQVPYRLPELIEAVTNHRIVFVVEGEKDVDNLRARGVPATCNAGGAGKWKAELNQYFRDADAIVIPDNDPQTKNPKTGELRFHPGGRPILPGQDHAREVCQQLAGIARRVRLLDLAKHWPDMPLKGDPSDWLTDGGGTVEKLYEIAEQTAEWWPAENAVVDGSREIERLAKLSLLEYDRQRQAATKFLGIRAPILDKLVKVQRAETEESQTALPHWHITPWDCPVSGAELLDEIKTAFDKYIVLPDGAGEAFALWVLHAWTMDAGDISPFMVLVSPTKRCGKTSVMTILYYLTPKSELTSNISASALFRYIEEVRPTLLIDEADSFLKDNEEMRGILNSGHTRTAAHVIRNVEVNGEHKPRRFSTWAPKAIATIRELADTIEDRSIITTMQRKPKEAAVARLRKRDNDDFAKLRRQRLGGPRTTSTSSRTPTRKSLTP